LTSFTNQVIFTIIKLYFMARRRITHYAIFHNVGSTSEINVYYEGGGANTISGLSISEAAYIIDILRNEKPMDYDHDRRRFLSGSLEPVGEGE
jgi:hypothetical protein